MAAPTPLVSATGDHALFGLRRRLANDAVATHADSIVARVRRRNELLDEQIRRNAAQAQQASRGASPEPGSIVRGGTPSSLANKAPTSPPSEPMTERAPPPDTAKGEIGEGGARKGGESPSDPSVKKTPTTELVPLPATQKLLTQVQKEALKPPAVAAGGRSHMRVDTVRLAELKRYPKNLSPAAKLHLDPLLPPPLPDNKDKNVLVLDIDETLVHASFTPDKPFDVKLTIEVEGEVGHLFVAYRPGMMAFLEAVAPLFEIVIFTASQSCYADQLMDHIDPRGKLGRMRLFREHCTHIRGARVKDLGLLGRPLERVAIIDNSPVAYRFQQRNAIPIVSWFDDPNDKEFDRLLPMLQELARSNEVYDVLDPFNCLVPVRL